MSRKLKRKPMFIVKMGEGEIAEFAYRLDKTGKLVKNQGKFQKPQNMRFRINTNELRELLGNSDFNEDEFFLKKQEITKNKSLPKTKMVSEISEATPNPNDGGHSSKVDVMDIFNSLESCPDMDIYFGKWDGFKMFNSRYYTVSPKK